MKWMELITPQEVAQAENRTGFKVAYITLWRWNCPRFLREV